MANLIKNLISAFKSKQPETIYNENQPKEIEVDITPNLAKAELLLCWVLDYSPEQAQRVLAKLIFMKDLKPWEDQVSKLNKTEYYKNVDILKLDPEDSIGKVNRFLYSPETAHLLGNSNIFVIYSKSHISTNITNPIYAAIKFAIKEWIYLGDSTLEITPFCLLLLEFPINDLQKFYISE